MMSGKDFLKGHVLSWQRKLYSDWEDVTPSGRVFQVFGPATEKAWHLAKSAITEITIPSERFIRATSRLSALYLASGRLPSCDCSSEWTCAEKLRSWSTTRGKLPMSTALPGSVDVWYAMCLWHIGDSDKSVPWKLQQRIVKYKNIM